MKWRLIQDKSLSGIQNMAIDEAILSSVSAGQSLPTLRFYSWHPKCVSLGYFQNLENSINKSEVENLKIDCVRRPTGGRIILHGNDISYSITAPSKLLSKNIFSLYLKISSAISLAFQDLGVPAKLFSKRDFEIIDPIIFSKASAEEISEMFKDKTNSYHETSAPYDIVLDNGIRILGSTQTRRNGVLLQQGSIALSNDLDTLSKIVNPDLRSDDMQEKHLMNTTNLVLNLDKNDLINKIISHLSRELDAQFEEDTLNPLEIASLIYLNKKYTSSIAK